MTVMTDGAPAQDRPPLPLRLLGQALSQAIARAPVLWPVLRGPTERFWERSAGSWDDRIKPDRGEHLAPLSAACERMEVEPRSILELGTGTGAGAIMLARRYPQARVHAIDLSAAMIEAARKKIPGDLAERIELEVGDAASLPYRNETFDLVSQLNLPIYLEQAARVLRPGGYLIVGSSLGSSTPYYTPDAVLSKRCREHGLDAVAAAKANGGSYFLARRSDIQQCDAATTRVRGYYDRTASKYDRQIRLFERILFGDGRQWVCSQASGDVLEIAVGTGRNLRYYPHEVRVTGIELSPEMLELARGEAVAIGCNADLRVGDAQKLEFPDESFDTVICTLSLCTIPGDRAAVREARRVLRPGGRLVLMEHVRSPIRAIRVGQRLLEPLFLRFEHDHLTRDPLDYLETEGLEIQTVDRLKWGIVERAAARKPASSVANTP
ncbi:MAG: class I SAM-dependent methyltransferase [Solirubrobacterales bacterium]|nr:class I SAM-dependent methyltransferase [Solirubrobacterales bacterium]